MSKTIRGTDGYDRMDGTLKNEVFLGFDGGDLIRELPLGSAGGSDDVFHGMRGDDQLISYDGSDLLFGGKGDDEMVIVVREADLVAVGGEGADRLNISGLAEADAHIDDRGDKVVITNDDGFRLVVRGIEDFDFVA